MTNWAVFNDEGMLENELTREHAQTRAVAMIEDGDPNAYADQECHDHEGEPKSSCEKCNEEGD